jgi:crossover junction endodeoxyribonuclease RuvC
VDKRILSIDPGLSFTGWAIIENLGNAAILKKYGVIKLPRTSTLNKKLYDIYFTLFEIISSNNITHLALETPFLGKNAATFLKLGYIRGTLLLLAEIHDLSVSDFSPQAVKRAVTGYGASDKEAVSRAVCRIFRIENPLEKYDISDAIAVGLCALRSFKDNSSL